MNNQLFKELEFWSAIYELSFQFWPNQNNVFISKDEVDIQEFGGYDTMQEVVMQTCGYLRSINPKMYREFCEAWKESELHKNFAKIEVLVDKMSSQIDESN